TGTVPVPGVVGEPLIAPVAGSSVRPSGRRVADHVYGVRPPVAPSARLYGWPTSAGAEAGAIARASTTVIAYVCTSERVPSVTFTSKWESPGCVGVPESIPVDALSVIPLGSAPEETDHVCVPPPAAVNWRLYAWLRMP